MNSLIFISKKLPDLCNRCYKKFVSAYGIYCCNCKYRIDIFENLESIKYIKKTKYNYILFTIRTSKKFNEYLYNLNKVLKYINIIEININLLILDIPKINNYMNKLNNIIKNINNIIKTKNNYKLFTPNTNTFILSDFRKHP